MNSDEIAELITRRRRQLLVHSIIYYDMDDNIISDHQWAKWALELEELQAKYPDIAKKCPRAKEFEGFTEDTGVNLNLKDPYAIAEARRLWAYERGECYDYGEKLGERIDNAKRRLDKKDYMRIYDFDFKLNVLSYDEKHLYYYDVILYRPYTVNEFVEAAIRYKEYFGFIGIDQKCGTPVYPRCEYRFGNVVEPFPDICRGLKVVSAEAVFGLDRIDYMLSVEEI